jgi:tetratricopeptide (TPR) repeat protein
LGPTYRGTRTYWARLTLSGLAVLALYPRPSVAQSPALTSIPLESDTNSSRVSVRQLQIPRKAREAFNKGTQLLTAKKAAAAIAQFQRAIKVFPDFYEAYYKIGLANLTLQRPRDAQGAFETSIELSKGRYPPSQFGLGLALCSQKEFAQAEEAIRAGLDQYPADPAGNFTLAWVQFGAGKLQEAEKSARQATLSNSNLAGAYLLLAQIHARQGQLLALVSDLDAYLRVDPKGPHNAEAEALRLQVEQMLAKQRGNGNGPVLAKTPNP